MKKQPSVCAGDYSEEELYQWVQQKAQSLASLKGAQNLRECMRR